MTNEKKKVDEEWKKRAQEEKEKLSAGAAAKKEPQSTAPPPPLPEADFAQFVTGLATQALMHLGELEHSASGKKETSLEQTRYLIDILQMLEEKTRGNLTDEENKILTGLLNDLRWRYVNASG